MMKKTYLILLLVCIRGFAQQSSQHIAVPVWAKDAIFYQIFPERFANGDSTNDPPGVEPWGGVPKLNNYFGGDLQGIINHLDYLQSLGINALYFNPIFESNTNHKYQTKNYFKIDPHFGDEKIFKLLLDECHRRKMHVIIDGVFNHTSIEFFAFQDIVMNGNKSKYLKWYDVHSFPVLLPPAKPNYEAWWGIGELPKLMADNPDVRKYLFDVTLYWMERGLDGWRLDVPNEMSHDFWIQWRKLVKSENRDAFIVGEIWDDALPWLKGDQFDAVMNYRFRGACVGFIALENRTAFQFDSILSAARNEYPLEVNYALQNLIGSHDTERFLTLCDGDASKEKLAVLMQMTYIGSPMIYYGDEIGMNGGKDPDCRRTMMWDSARWDMDLWKWYKKLIKIRNDNAVFRHGSFKSYIADSNKKLLAFIREYENTTAVVILNMSTSFHKVSMATFHPSSAKWLDLLNNKKVELSNIDSIAVSPRSGMVLLSSKEK